MTERLACLNVCNNIRVNNELCYIFSLCEHQKVGTIALGGYLPTSTGWSNTFSDMQYCRRQYGLSAVLCIQFWKWCGAAEVAGGN